MKQKILVNPIETAKNTAPLSEFAFEVSKGLTSFPKYLSSRFFYDERGSRLFQQIMGLPEYYPTQCEYEILSTYKNEILELVRPAQQNLEVIEFGAGDGFKTKVLLNHFLNEKVDFTYLPIDISDSALEGLITDLMYYFPELKAEGICDDYFKALQKLQIQSEAKKLVLFLGSNIGNFPPAEAHQFLNKIRENLRPGDFLLIGFDLQKDPHTILQAYNDTAGVTREFNLNLLRRINNELGAHLKLSSFIHFPVYDPQEGCAKSFLVSTEKQEIYIENPGAEISLEAWESIHTEVSYKYTEAMISNFAQKNGFQIIRSFYDSRNYFADSVWEAV